MGSVPTVDGMGGLEDPTCLLSSSIVLLFFQVGLGWELTVFKEVTDQEEGWWIHAERCVSSRPLCRGGPVFLYVAHMSTGECRENPGPLTIETQNAHSLTFKLHCCIDMEQ